MPSFSVILCVNKMNPWFDRAVESILNQDDTDFEFLICANACQDDLWEKLISLRDSDNRVRIYRTSVGQLAFNLNYLADRASGDYLVRMDADDVSEPNRISMLREALTIESVDILGSAVHLIDENDEMIGHVLFPLEQEEICSAMPSRSVFCHPSVAVRRQFLLDIRGYLGGLVSEDNDLWLRAKRRGAKMKNLPQPLLRYRIHSNQTIGSREGYAETASQWFRELLIAPTLSNIRGVGIATFKTLFYKLLPRSKKYRLTA